MKKVFIGFLIALCIGANIFAQQQSVERIATNGMFESYSDNINAVDIYTLEESFATIGYHDTHMPFFATAFELTPTMNLGVYGDFDLADSINTTTNVTTWGTPFTFSLVLGTENSGFQYTVNREGTDTITKAANLTTTLENSDWQHTLTYGTTFDSGVRFSLPLLVNISKNATTEEGDVTAGGNGTSYKVTNSNIVVGLTPSIEVPLENDVAKSASFFAAALFSVYSESGLIDTKTDTTTITREANKDTALMDFLAGGAVKFEWDANEQLTFASQPTFLLNVLINDIGKEQETITDGVAAAPVIPAVKTITTEPMLILPIGLVYAPVEHFELRMGATYILEWEFKDVATAGAADTLNYAPSSTFDFTAGFGFTFSENFILDVAFSTAIEDMTFQPYTDLINEALTIQLTYTF